MERQRENSPLACLLGFLDVEQQEDDCFRGWSYDIGSRTVFGGHALAQSLIAAGRTVESKILHSLHAYFLRPGRHDHEIDYRVERIRDGRSFCVRKVTASQRASEIFIALLSFHSQEPGVEHRTEMPDVPGPEDLLSTQEFRRTVSSGFSESQRDILLRERPIEFRPVRPLHPLNPDKRPPAQNVWFRTAGPVPGQDSIHQALLAYASDFSLLATALLPHGMTFHQEGLQVVSLDHALWFHRPFRVDEWLLYAMDSPCAHGSRALARGSVFTRAGELVASVAQEGLIRVKA